MATAFIAKKTPFGFEGVYCRGATGSNDTDMFAVGNRIWYYLHNECGGCPSKFVEFAVNHKRGWKNFPSELYTENYGNLHWNQKTMDWNNAEYGYIINVAKGTLTIVRGRVLEGDKYTFKFLQEYRIGGPAPEWEIL